MPTIYNFVGFEHNTSSYIFNSGSGFSIQSTTKKHGAYALRINATGAGTAHLSLAQPPENGNSTAFSLSTVYLKTDFYYVTKPSANDEPFCTALGAGGTRKIELRLNSSGNVAAYAKGTTLLGTGSTVLSSSTWYNIEFVVNTGTSVNWEVRIDGVTEISGSGADVSSNNFQQFHFGKLDNRNSETVDLYYDNGVIADDWVGDCHVLPMRPNTDGSTHDFDNGTGSSDYAEVDEVPASTSDYIESTNTAGDIHLVGFESTTSAGISGSILSVKGTKFQYKVSGTNSSQHRFRSGSTNSDSSTEGDQGALWIYRQYLLDQDPDTSTAWTTSGLDSVEYGAIQNNASVVRVSYMALDVLVSPVTNTTVNASTLTITSSVQAPTVTAEQFTTVNASLINATSSVQSPSVQTGVTVNPSTLTSATSIETPSVETGVTISPSELTITSSVQAPIVQISEGLSISVLTATASVQSPTVTTIQNITINPSELSITSSIETPNVQINEAINVSELNLTTNLQAPSVTTTIGTTILVSVLTINSSVEVPGILTGITIALGPQELTSQVLSPVIISQQLAGEIRLSFEGKKRVTIFKSSQKDFNFLALKRYDY